MSVASEFAPEVFIPAPARKLGRGTPACRLRLVAPVREAAWSAVPRLAPERLTGRPPAVAVPGSPHTALGRATGTTPVRLLQRKAPVPILATANPGFAAAAGRTAALAAPIASAGRSTLRLTRRGIVVLFVGVLSMGTLMLLVAHLSAGSAPTASSGTTAASVPTATQVTVQSGDSLWSIARRLAPNRDPRVVISRLRAVNHLDSVSLTPGQTLKIG